MKNKCCQKGKFLEKPRGNLIWKLEEGARRHIIRNFIYAFQFYFNLKFILKRICLIYLLKHHASRKKWRWQITYLCSKRSISTCQLVPGSAYQMSLAWFYVGLRSIQLNRIYYKREQVLFWSWFVSAKCIWSLKIIR